MAADAAGDGTSSSAPKTTPAWLLPLDDNLECCAPDGPHGLDYILSSMLKEYLLSDDEDAPSTFARRFDDLYSTVYEPRFNGYNKTHKGWTGYLHVFYETLFTSAVEMQYDDPLQDKAVQLLVELGKLPVHHVKVFVQAEFEWLDADIWTRDPLLPWRLVSQEPFGTLTIDSYDDITDKDYASETFGQAAELWVNYHALNARCIGAGFCKGFKHLFDHEGFIISVGLTPGYPDYVNPKLDCHVMAAAQYIIHAGDVIDAECVKKQLPPHRHHSWKGWADGKGPAVWKQWGTRLAEIADAFESGGDLGFKLFDKNREAVRDMVIKARDKMVALEPELFTPSESEAAVEPGSD